MTPALRTAILDALMERWREGESEWSTFLANPSREYMSACLDMILPVAEPMIREAALREAEPVIEAARCIRHWHDRANGGMVVSGDHVRALWERLDEFDARIAELKAKTEP